jgi:type IV pilus assembly protein PilA
MLKLMRRMHSEKGFTLVELMVVVVIIGVLVAIAIPIMNNVTKNAAQKAHDSNLRTIDGAVQMYYAQYNKWPENIDELYDEFIEGVLEIPEAVLDDLSDTEYSIDAGEPPRAQPVGNWGGYRDDSGTS